MSTTLHAAVPSSQLPRLTPRTSGLLIALALAVATLVIYLPALQLPFVNYDDTAYYGPQNPRVGGGLNLKSFAWAWSTFEATNWHPLTWLSLQLDASLFGKDPFGFHLTSVLLHSANVALLFAALQALTGRRWPSAVVAALFAVHPLRVESVAWVSERKDVLAGFFGFLTLLAYVWYCRRPGTRRYVLVLAAFGLGLLAKPMLVTLPCVLLLLDYWPLHRFQPDNGSPTHSWRRPVWEKIPLFALSAISCATTVFAQTAAMQTPVGFLGRVENAVVAYARYLWMTVWPTQLCVFYPHPRDRISLAAVAGSVLLLAGITGLALGFRRSRPYLIVGWLWFLGMLVPVIGLLQVGDQALADRYTYLPQIGIFIALTWVLADLCERWRVAPPIAIAGVALVLAALGLATRVQLTYWEDNAALWQRSLDVEGPSAVAEAGLGGVLRSRERTDEAIEHLRAAVALDPKNPRYRYMLAETLQHQGRKDEALEEVRESLRLAPGGGPEAKAVRLYGWLLEAQGRHDEALDAYQRAFKTAPGSADLRLYLGGELERHGDLAAALGHYRAAVQLEPDLAAAHYNLGSALGKLGQLDEAVRELSEAVRLDSANARAHNNLGIALEDQGRVAEAEQQYREALRLQPDLVPAQRNLNALLAKKAR